ncbi:cleavage and polyadenylation specificity factor subunit 6-like [Manis pentadactyla]|uniref:cleavage and polyadenylation specificity factor subunit 6-like n=1 Tax=Manis pentadactyla TaxID=143292 RepID=UPI00255D0B6D|nr:cleavage and polyadenylation specificity factor subunit 6-like [Manis pentadactyla]XP_057356425.1 cleavage and polyadenylation specificity factor subunit 6-like [Manis pentadactyla]
MKSCAPAPAAPPHSPPLARLPGRGGRPQPIHTPVPPPPGRKLQDPARGDSAVIQPRRRARICPSALQVLRCTRRRLPVAPGPKGPQPPGPPAPKPSRTAAPMSSLGGQQLAFLGFALKLSGKRMLSHILLSGIVQVSDLSQLP